MGLGGRIVIRDKGTRNFINSETKFIKEVSNIDLELIAKQCEQVIKETIMRKAKNPTGYLASFFNAEPIANGWGVGDISTLDSQCPYWAHQNYGSLGIGANWEHTLPKGRWFGGVWIEDDSGYFATPKTPIPAMNYIEDSIAQMSILIPQILRT